MADSILTDKEVIDSLPEETRDIYSKYMESFYFLQARKHRQAKQLVLLNNLQRGDENIASTLILTLFNRTLAKLYDDKMQIRFVPSEEMDNKQLSSLDILAQNDHREMNMPEKDYDWCWDALFFGRGYIETLRFDPKRKIMQPSVINPLVFGYDPYFENVQDWRYYWKWISKSSLEINQLIEAGVLKNITKAEDLPSGMENYLWEYKIIRERAKEATPVTKDSYKGDIHQILEFFGYNSKGKKCVRWVDRNFAKVIYERELDLRDGSSIVLPTGEEKGKGSQWPLVIKEAFREPHSSINFSVADLLEDKHRARSVLLNLAFLAAKDRANPIYQYNPDLVKDVTQLYSRQVYQHIPVMDIERAIAPLNKDTALDPTLQAFLNVLNQEAADPIGSGEAGTTQKKGNQTATEEAIDQQLDDLANSLESKIMKFGASEFWSHWYQRYLRYTKAGDEKIATVVGVKGVTFEKIHLEAIRTKYPPKALVFSAKEAEYKELVERRDFMQILPLLTNSLSPDGMRNFQKYVFLPKFQSLDPQTIDILVPDTIDEIDAEQENERIANNEMPEVEVSDNHEQHIAVHYQAKNSWAKWVHIKWHEELLSKQRMQAMNQPLPSPQDAQQVPEPKQPQEGVINQKPLEAAASLRKETERSLQEQKLSNLSV